MVRASLRASGSHRIASNRVSLLSEDQARGWLSYNVHAYERVFGAVEVA